MNRRGLSSVTVHFHTDGRITASIARGSGVFYQVRYVYSVSPPSMRRLWNVLQHGIDQGNLSAIIWADGWSVYPVENEEVA